MSPLVSRTVHVTVNIAVEVPVTEAQTERDALIYAMNHHGSGSEFNCSASIFDVTTADDIEAQKRAAFRRKLGLTTYYDGRSKTPL